MKTLGKTLGSVLSMLLLSFSTPVSIHAQPSQDLMIYDDSLHTPWINASWSAQITFGSTEQAYEGTSSVKAALTSAWGALSLHHGNWGSAGVNSSTYETLDFAVYPLAAGSFSIFFENDQGQSFPKVNSESVDANAWVPLSISVEQLNPNNQTIHRLVIQDISGQPRTFYVDAMGLIGGTGGSPPPAPPMLASPPHEAMIDTTTVAFVWHTSEGATSYTLLVFPTGTGDTFHQSDIADTTYTLEGLRRGNSYSWQVSATNSSGTSDWSDMRGFYIMRSIPPRPQLASPENGASGVSTSPVLSWNGTADAEYVHGQISTDAQFSDTTREHTGLGHPPNPNSWSVTGLEKSTTYYWRLAAVNESGRSDWSEVWSFTTESGAPTPAPGWAIGTSGTSNTLRDVYFADASTGTAVGDGGTIIRTTDGGATWTAQSSGTTASIAAVSFTDANNGTAVSGGRVFRTTDGGTTWIPRDPPSQYSVFYTDASFLDANIGTVVGNPGGFNGFSRRTTDGGLTWTENQNIRGFDQTTIFGVSFFDLDKGIAVGQALEYSYEFRYLTARTLDGGATWSVVPVGPRYPPDYASSEAILYDVSYADANTAFAVGTDGIIARSTDGGATWTTRYSSREATLYAVHFTDANTGTAVGASGTIVRTTDGGVTWQVHASGTTETLYGVSFVDANRGTIVGTNGTVLRTTSGGSFPPSAPNILAPENGETNLPVSPTLSWEPVPNATDYHLQVSTTSDFSLLIVNNEHTMETSHTIPMLSNEVTYYWRVHSRSVGGSSDWATRSFSTEPLPAEPSWISQSSGTAAALRGVSFADANAGIAVGDSGVILRTTNGGLTWARQTSGTTSVLHGISFPDVNTAFAVSLAGNVLRSTDGGVTWTQVSNFGSRAVSFIDASTGMVGGFSGGIEQTTNGGVTWQHSDGPAALDNVWGISQGDAQNAVAVGVYYNRGAVPALSSTANGGAYWFPQATWSPSGDPQFHSVSMPDGETVTLVGERGTIWRGTDYSTAQPSVTSSNLYAVDFVDADNGTAVGTAGAIVYTSNGGTTWRKQKSGTSVTLLGVSFVNDSTGWAVGEGGTILRTNTSGTPSTPPPTQNMVVYDEDLHNPWVNASWGGTVSFDNSEQTQSGSNSIKVTPSGSWGALSVHHGSWGSPGITDADSYESLDFWVYSTNTASLYISFANDQSQSFPSRSRSIAAGSWIPVSVPMSELNPNGQTIHRLSIQKSTAGVWYADNLKLVGGQTPAAAAATAVTETIELPTEFGLSQNYPNPFNPSTVIRYEIPGGVRSQGTEVGSQTSEVSQVTLTVYDMLGREVAVLVDEEKTPGFYSVSFDAGMLASGVYIYRIVASKGDGEPFIRTNRMLLLK